MKTALVTGAGGTIGHQLVKRLKEMGYWVRGVDLVYPEFSETEADEFIIADLRDPLKVSLVMFSPDQHSLDDKEYAFDFVFALAAQMGGASYVFTGDNDATIMHDSVLINANTAHYASLMSVKKLFFASSACVYPIEWQNEEAKGFHNKGLREDFAWPAHPDSVYGLEKLFSEKIYDAYARNYGLNIRIGRFHNIYSTECHYNNGREKFPAAVCRKVIESDGIIEIFGDGKQTRSFLYIDDCLDAVILLMDSFYKKPINIGSEEMVSINELAQMVIAHSEKKIEINHIDGPQGVRGRNSDNTLIRKVLNWEPKVKLQDGIKILYNWIQKEIERNT